MIIANHKLRKVTLMLGANFSNQGFWRHALLLGLKHNGSAVGVISTNIATLMALHLLKPDPNISLNVFH